MEKHKAEERKKKLRIVERYDNDDYSRFAASDYREEQFQLGEEDFDHSPHQDKERMDRYLKGNWHHPGVSGKTDDGDVWINEQEYAEQVNFIGYGPKGYTRSDDRIYEEVCDTLMRHREIDASNIGVRVEKGIVTLSGRVQTRRMKKLSEFAIEDLPGVQDVRNELSVIRGVDTNHGPDAAVKKDLGLS